MPGRNTGGRRSSKLSTNIAAPGGSSYTNNKPLQNMEVMSLHSKKNVSAGDTISGNTISGKRIRSERPCFSVYLKNELNVSNNKSNNGLGPFDYIAFDTDISRSFDTDISSYITNDNFNTSNGQFTVPNNGLYFFETNIICSSDQIDAVFLINFKAGLGDEKIAGSYYGMTDSGDNGAHTSSGCWHLRLRKGDLISVGIEAVDSNVTIKPGREYTWFRGGLIYELP